MRKVLAGILLVCTLLILCACAKPTDAELRQELTTLVAKAAQEELEAASYYRVEIDTLEADGKNKWLATGNVNFSDTSTSTIAVLYTATLRYDKAAKDYKVDVTFGEVFYL